MSLTTIDNICVCTLAIYSELWGFAWASTHKKQIGSCELCMLFFSCIPCMSVDMAPGGQLGRKFLNPKLNPSSQ